MKESEYQTMASSWMMKQTNVRIRLCSCRVNTACLSTGRTCPLCPSLCHCCLRTLVYSRGRKGASWARCVSQGLQEGEQL